ncbi:MAG: hypothetical protein J5922_05280 [Clostridia bacterium]|nr:hypothetical protein [Clostridia bacterium]
MAYRCINGGECDGCGECRSEKEVAVCEVCGEAICRGEEYTEILGEAVCTDCAKKALTEAECDIICSCCSDVIRCGDDYYDILGEKICRDCAQAMIAE